MGNPGQEDVDRRQYHTVRRVFTEACELIAPMILQGFSGSGVSGYALVHMVHDRFPELTDEEVHVLLTAAMRMRDDGKLREIIGAQS
jgi:hypothetical protein